MIVRVASRPPVSINPTTSERTRLHDIAMLAVDTYLEDVRELIGEELGALVHSDTFQQGSVEDANMKMRWRTYQGWRDLTEPLAWGPRGETYMKVVRMVVDDEDLMPHGVPVSTTDKCSLEDFVNRIFLMGTKTTLRSVQAPLLRKGATWPVLTMVIRECEKRLGEASEATAQTICTILVNVFKERKVEYVPDKSGSGPNPTMKAWTILNQAPDARTAHLDPSLQNPRERRVFELSQHTRVMIETAVNSEWNATNLAIGEYHKYLDRTLPPIDFRRDPKESLAPEVQVVYDWANSEFHNSFQSWKSQLAITLAFLVSKVLPNVHLPAASELVAIKSELANTSPQDQEKAIPIIRKIKFTSKNVGGSKDQRTYFTIASIVILAFINPDSPLRQKLESSGKLDDVWSSKHRE